MTDEALDLIHKIETLASHHVYVEERTTYRRRPDATLSTTVRYIAWFDDGTPRSVSGPDLITVLEELHTIAETR